MAVDESKLQDSMGRMVGELGAVASAVLVVLGDRRGPPRPRNAVQPGVGGQALKPKEIIMGRKYIDCRAFPSEMNCTVALCADEENELLEAAVQHAVYVHKHQDTPELRQQLKALFKEGTPPLEAPARG